MERLSLSGKVLRNAGAEGIGQELSSEEPTAATLNGGLAVQSENSKFEIRQRGQDSLLERGDSIGNLQAAGLGVSLLDE